MARASITRRLSLLFVASSSAVLLALGFVIAAAVERHFVEQDMETIARQMDLARHALAQVEQPGDLRRIEHVLDDAMVGQRGPVLLVFGADGTPLLATEHARIGFDQVVRSAAIEPPVPALWKAEGRNYRGIAAALTTGSSASTASPTRLYVAVGIDIMHHESFMRAFRRTLWMFVLGAAALTGLLGWAAARRGLAPLRAMREQAQAVTAQQLGQRLPVDAVPDELAELALSLNAMLARLDEAFQRLSHSSSDIAHELRTPVNNLMTQTQVALSRVRDADEYRGILESNAEELERLARMISDMLLLAKADNGLVVPNPEAIDLESELHDLLEYFEAVAEDKDLKLRQHGSARVNADRVMLRRALTNLLSNAMRHAAPGSGVSAIVETGAAEVSIAIENTGETIAPEYLERIFDRFYRVDPSRQRNREGTGLGLAITRSIVAAHGGTISAASKDGLTRFTIRLPRP